MIDVVLDNAVARGEIPAGRDLVLIADAALGLNILRAITGRPIDRVFVRRVLEDVILPLATAPVDRYRPCAPKLRGAQSPPDGTN